jgi:methylenetetrahydrofolate dehydrogenase (NADP+)/methenyltetrahydrofolate cyclohydrolase
LASGAEEADVKATVGKLNADPRISGILILRPLPGQISEANLYPLLDPLKDIEAVHPENAGLLALGRPRYVPSTPASCFFMLDRYVEDSGRDPSHFYDGLNLVLVGRSNNVGKPAVWLGLARNATVVSAHRETYDSGRLAEHTRSADILIVAAGVPKLIRAEHVRDGVIAIDVGINPSEDPRTGKIHMVGDIDFQGVAERAEAISPVPGGVGPVTDVFVLSNTLSAAAIQSGTADVVRGEQQALR